MKIQKSILILNLLACAMFSIQADTSLKQQTLLSKVLGFIAQSKPVYLFEKYVHAKMPKMLPYGDEPASLEYQQFGKEAQNALDIPEERHVSIRKIVSTHPLAQYVGAVAEPEAIYVNEDKLNQRLYGARRCALFHEAVHKKYSDISADLILELGTFVGSSVIAHKLIQAIKTPGKYKILHGLGVVFGGLCVTGLASTKFHHFMERRADIEGHYAAQCPTCVHEAAVQRRISFDVENSPLKHNGYLWAEDLEKIALDLAQENKLCVYHKERIQQKEPETAETI